MLQQVLPFMSGSFEGFRSWSRTQPWRQQQQQQQRNSPNVPSLRTVQSQLQLRVQDVWLQLGPALRALCRRSSGEAAEEEEDENKGRCFMVHTGSGQLLGDVAPRQVFATYSEMLVAALTVSVSQGRKPGPTVNLAAIVEQNPLLAVSVMEAALHVLPESSGRTPAAAAAAAALGALTSSKRIERASTLCLHAAAVLPILAEVAAARLAPALQHTAGSAAGTAAGKAAGVQQAAATTGASAANNSDSSKLQQKMFCCFVAGVKYAQFSANLTRSAGPLDAEVLDCYLRSVTLLVTISAAAVKMLGEASAASAGLSQLSAEKQLLWFQVLARWVVAAGQLLQHIPQLVAFGGGLAPGQPSLFSGFAAAMGLCVMTLQSMLQEGRAAAAAVEAGLPAAAVTPEDLARLRQASDSMQMLLAPLVRAFCSGGPDRAGGNVAASMQHLLAACQEGGLAQQLYSSGSGCAAAFPQRGCCGNPACTNLDKFSEGALASQGCSGCHKAVKFCSPACHKTAWKQGHKAACGVLKQRHAAGAATAKEGA